MLRIKFNLLPILLLPLLSVSHASAQELEKLLTAKTFKSAGGESLPYRLLVPANYDRVKKYPLIVFLHGSGGLGNDNLKQLQLGNLAAMNPKPHNTKARRSGSFTVRRMSRCRS